MGIVATDGVIQGISNRVLITYICILGAPFTNMVQL